MRVKKRTTPTNAENPDVSPHSSPRVSKCVRCWSKWEKEEWCGGGHVVSASRLPSAYVWYVSHLTFQLQWRWCFLIRRARDANYLLLILFCFHSTVHLYKSTRFHFMPFNRTLFLVCRVLFPANAMLLITIYFSDSTHHKSQITILFLLVYAIFQRHSTSMLCTSRKNRTSAIYVRIIGWVSSHTWYDTTRKNTRNTPYLGVPSSIDAVTLYILRDTRTSKEVEPNLMECWRWSRVFQSHAGVFVHGYR